MVVNRYQVTCRVNTTNDGSNYWTLYLREASTNTNIQNINTSALSPSSTTWSFLSATVEHELSLSEVGLYVYVEKTGSPGALDVLGIIVAAS